MGKEETFGIIRDGDLPTLPRASHQLAQDIADAICRRSPLIGDNTGLILTGEEWAAIYEIVGKHYVGEKIMVSPFIPSVADLIKQYE